jgi:hypothetical protein
MPRFLHRAISGCLLAGLCASGCAHDEAGGENGGAVNQRVQPTTASTSTPAPSSASTMPGNAVSAIPRQARKARRFQPRLPDQDQRYGTITLREASLFHERLLEACEEDSLGLSYSGALAQTPHFQGMQTRSDPTRWNILEHPPRKNAWEQQELDRLLFAIRLAETQPSGAFLRISIEGHRLFVTLEGLDEKNADQPMAELLDKSPREFLQSVSDSFTNTTKN